MLNQQFGIVNRMFGLNVPWLDGQWAPYGSILLVNLWLGFPYMFLVCTGALQGIPSDLKEAAFVDGATGLHAFKRITLPLLLIAVAPLLIASFAFNFNNFNIIYLLTEGKPPIPRSDAGRTDILISYTYKLAFAGGRGADYGFASAVSVIIFMLVAGISAFSFRYTRAFEEVK
jgi:arabinogalactan oligomer/maltooligosaccharide transport system permease protein